MLRSKCAMPYRRKCARRASAKPGQAFQDGGALTDGHTGNYITANAGDRRSPMMPVGLLQQPDSTQATREMRRVHSTLSITFDVHRMLKSFPCPVCILWTCCSTPAHLEANLAAHNPLSSALHVWPSSSAWG
ncbi:uncharacterized protein LOC144179561 [Haemaphysalis longicornis]